MSTVFASRINIMILYAYFYYLYSIYLMLYRELLIYFFNLKKSASETNRLFAEVYNEDALSGRTCREWFQKFKNGVLDVKDKYRSGRPKIYEDAALEKLLEEDSSQTQKELALTLEVTQQAVSHRLKSLGMINKQGNWVQEP
ncbi:hypothetical protein K1T71_013276 [Dendrolimus kikuchii]|uniref:Uncharacterized protein n=1 Tax=Dendrolimus kikuchii TaxID=765133 RepID=A0ACC1CHN3_9NEOP|nr:hypothetical protein K1T71_013276 [Dendrolimus kikuchii]